VAEGFRSAVLLAVAFLLLAAVAAARMPRLDARDVGPALVTPQTSLDTPMAQ
jgi:hypothetical protein